MSIRLHDNYQNENSHVTMEEYDKIKKLINKRKGYAKCYSICILLLVLTLSVACIFKVSHGFRHHRHHNHGFKHYNKDQDHKSKENDIHNYNREN